MAPTPQPDLWQRVQRWLRLLETANPEQVWPAEATDQATRAHIDATTAALKQEIEGITYSARERAWSVAEHGVEIGDKGSRLYTGGVNEWVAPKLHPVWASEVAREARILQQMGSATFEYEGLYRKLEEWHPSPVPYGDYLVMTLPEYERWLRGGDERSAVEQELVAPLRTPGEIAVVNPYGNVATTLEIVARDNDRKMVIDTSDQDMGAGWQRTLVALQTRLDALTQTDQTLHQHQDQGLSY